MTVLAQAVILENKDRSHNLGTWKYLSEPGSLAALEPHICLRLSTLDPFHLKENETPVLIKTALRK